jgi:hypothetical protein
MVVDGSGADDQELLVGAQDFLSPVIGEETGSQEAVAKISWRKSSSLDFELPERRDFLPEADLGQERSLDGRSGDAYIPVISRDRDGRGAVGAPKRRHPRHSRSVTTTGRCGGARARARGDFSTRGCVFVRALALVKFY